MFPGLPAHRPRAVSPVLRAPGGALERHGPEGPVLRHTVQTLVERVSRRCDRAAERLRARDRPRAARGGLPTAPRHKTGMELANAVLARLSSPHSFAPQR